MKLHELAIGCWIYKNLSGADSRLAKLRSATSGQLDPCNSHHQKALFKWLNQWGCRQFSRAHHATAAQSLEAWATKWISILPRDSVMFEEIDQAQIKITGASYADLRETSGRNANTN